MNGMISYNEDAQAYAVTDYECQTEWPDGALPDNGFIIATQACYGVGQIEYDID